MVRLVFRPYTQVWRTICTSVPLRASIRVSPDFTLLRHSSPSFGSVQHCLYSNLSPKIKVGRLCKNPNCHFHYAYRFATHTLAIVDDSLVRVSRRVEKNHFVNVLDTPCNASSTLWTQQSRIPTNSPADYDKMKGERIPNSRWRSSEKIRQHNSEAPKNSIIPETLKLRWLQMQRNTTGTPLNSNNSPCGTEATVHFVQQQSLHKKLVSFASLSAISRTFNPLSKVLFTFPSRYLFAIGLGSIFSFRRNLPPI